MPTEYKLGSLRPVENETFNVFEKVDAISPDEKSKSYLKSILCRDIFSGTKVVKLLEKISSTFEKNENMNLETLEEAFLSEVYKIYDTLEQIDEISFACYPFYRMKLQYCERLRNEKTKNMLDEVCADSRARASIHFAIEAKPELEGQIFSIISEVQRQLDIELEFRPNPELIEQEMQSAASELYSENELEEFIYLADAISHTINGRMEKEESEYSIPDSSIIRERFISKFAA